jgi:energy-converting hydrogenase Eha subunit E
MPPSLMIFSLTEIFGYTGYRMCSLLHCLCPLATSCGCRVLAQVVEMEATRMDVVEVSLVMLIYLHVTNCWLFIQLFSSPVTL